jgi:hypothetical protein
LRVLSVVILIGMGASVAAVGGIAGAGGSGTSARGALVGADPVGTATAGTATPVAFDVAGENRRPGTHNWRISAAAGRRSGLDAYAGAVSVTAGQAVPLMVNGDGNVEVRAMRVGWYGGLGARQVWRGTLRATPTKGKPGSWQARGWATTAGWPEGDYLLRLDQGDASRYLPLTVRSPDTKGKILVLTSPLTWQAENTFGTTSSSAGSSNASSKAGKDQTVSFARPYAAGFGSGGFLADDFPVVQQAERTGRDLAYATDYDVAQDPSLTDGVAAIVVGGDSSYWTTSVRTAVRKAEDAGANLAVFGSGAGSGQIKILSGGRRLRVSAAPATPAATLRLTGVRPSCSSSDTGNTSDVVAKKWTLEDTDWWGYQNTGAKSGDTFAGLIADDVDRADTSSSGSPKRVQVLSVAQADCAGPAGTDVTDGSSVAQSAVYSTTSAGAGLFTAATGRWACAVGNTCVDGQGKHVDVPARSRRFAAQVTRNVIGIFAKPEAGRRHPASDNADQFGSQLR